PVSRGERTQILDVSVGAHGRHAAGRRNPLGERPGNWWPVDVEPISGSASRRGRTPSARRREFLGGVARSGGVSGCGGEDGRGGGVYRRPPGNVEQPCGFLRRGNRNRGGAIHYVD